MDWIREHAILVLGISVGFVWLLFLLIVFLPRLLRSFAELRIVKKPAGIILGEYSFADILLWSQQTAEAMINLTKAYDWRVSQWSGFATAILTATLGFISAVVIEYFKDTIYTETALKLQIAFLGVMASLLVYLICQHRISRLKRQFLRLYNLLLLRGEN